MKAKKLISIALLAASGISAQAQIVSSQSNQVIVTEQVKPEKPKEPRNSKFYAKAGLAMDNQVGDVSVDATIGYDIDFGFTKPFGKSNTYWGMELGVMSKSCSVEGFEIGMGHNIHFSPFMLSFHFPVSETIDIVPFLGPYASFNLNWYGAEKSISGGSYIGYSEDSELLDAGLNLGCGVWIGKNFSLDLHVRKGFASYFDYYEGQYRGSNSLLKIVLSAGVIF